MSKTVLVAGATGRQGGSVVETLCSGEYGDFEQRGLREYLVAA